MVKNNWSWTLYMADSEAECNRIGGSFKTVDFKPLTVTIFVPEEVS